MRTRAFGTLLLLTVPLSCREAETHSKAGPKTTSVARPASSQPRHETTPVAEGSSEEAAGPLIAVTGDALLARVRASRFRAVVVNAWASWCGPCRRELPMLVGMQTNLELRGIGVMLVSVDEPSSRAAAVSFLQEHGAELPSYVAERPLGPFKVALNPKWPGMLPASFLFDKAGKLRYFWGGEVFEQELLDIVDKFLAGTLVDGEARYGLIPGKVEPHQ